jgi:dTDP-4-dehydrorhamnose 3,5-epimerase
MIFKETKLKGCFEIEPIVFKDERGYFLESFNQKKIQEGIGEKVHFVQDNQSFSTQGVLRGLHYQTGEYAQAKLVRVLQGEVLDVAVDIRPNSPTYGQSVAVVLSDTNHKQFYIPRGFAHGFQVISKTAIFFYKCDNFYNKESEGGIKYNDPSLNIEWAPFDSEYIISEKDQFLPDFKNARKAW